MLKNILVGLNGTQFSQAAVALSIAWAQRHQASLVGLAVVDVPGITAPEPVPLGGSRFKAERDAAIVEQAEHQADRVLAEFVQRCQQAGVACRPQKLEGDPAQVLVTEAQRADLLVVGRKSMPAGDGAATRVIDHVLRDTARPVVCVPAAAQLGAPVLVAYDGSVQSARTLQAFQALGLANGRQIHVLTVSQQGVDTQVAEVAADYLRSHGHDVHTQIDDSGQPPAAAILAEADRLQVGAIVLGSYGKRTLRDLIFGSVAREVLREAKTPLFLYH